MVSSSTANDRLVYNATSDTPSAVSTQSEYMATEANGQGVCTDARFDMNSVSIAPGGALRFEQQVLFVPPFPADSTASCPLELAAAAAATTPCSGLTVLKAHYVEAF